MSDKIKEQPIQGAKADGAIYYKDATELATLIRTKQLSSREVVQAHLDRTAAVNPKVNAVVTLMTEGRSEGRRRSR